MRKHPPIKDYAQEFKKLIAGFHHNRNIRDVFVDWLEVAACAIHQEPYHLGLVPRDTDFDKVEAEYMAAIKKYTKEELDVFARLFGITKMALWEKKTDFLGQIYMDLEISNDRSGEFFTPFEVSLMMAKMLLGDISSHIQEKGFITIGEPACGGGGMLVAAAKVIEEQGYHPGEVMFFDATDISKACASMAYLQTSILGLSGIVRHGNSLSLEQWNSKFTPVCRAFPARTNAMIDSITATKAEKSQKHDLPTPTMPQQEQPPMQPAFMFNLEQEALDREQPKAPDRPDASSKPIRKLAQETEVDPSALEQGRLF